MERIQTNSTEDLRAYTPENEERHFITANTIVGNLADIKSNHLIPVFVKDNEPVISQVEFIQTVQEVTGELFCGEHILTPSIRLSHPIKGRTPDAKDKSASQLQESEKTIYYERMAFIMEIPSIMDTIDGNRLSLTVGGVKAHNLDNLYNRKGTDEHFKIFIGFQNTVCTNLCIWTDGYLANVKVSNLHQLRGAVRSLIERYNANNQIQAMRSLSDHVLTEHQFAFLMGRCRMYQHLPSSARQSIDPLLLGDSQLNMACKDYYRDNSFCRDQEGNINLWRLYNLLTGANKSSYIDQFMDRSINAFQFVDQLRLGLQSPGSCWHLPQSNNDGQE
jgi:hypothetical protein